MKLDFYGTKLDPPTISTARAFGSDVEPTVLKGGQGTSYVSRNIVLKPADGVDEANSIAEVFFNLPESKEVRFTRSIKAIDGNWIYEGYVAWNFLPGEHVRGQYDKKLSASCAFHNLLKDTLVRHKHPGPPL